MADASEIEALPEFPLFDVDRPEVAFGCELSRYVGGTGDRYEAKRLGRRLERRLPEESKAFARMFYGGATLGDAGFRPKPNLDQDKVRCALAALMGSWSPSCEQKTGTVALAIHHWCEPIPTLSSPQVS